MTVHRNPEDIFFFIEVIDSSIQEVNCVSLREVGTLLFSPAERIRADAFQNEFKKFCKEIEPGIPRMS